MESRSGFALRCPGEEWLVFSDNVATQLSAGPLILIPSIPGVKFIPIVSISPPTAVCTGRQLFQVLPSLRIEQHTFLRLDVTTILIQQQLSFVIECTHLAKLCKGVREERAGHMSINVLITQFNWRDGDICPSLGNIAMTTSPAGAATLLTIIQI